MQFAHLVHSEAVASPAREEKDRGLVHQGWFRLRLYEHMRKQKGEKRGCPRADLNDPARQLSCLRCLIRIHCTTNLIVKLFN